MDCNKNEIFETKKDEENNQKSVETNNNFEPNKETSSSCGGDIESVPSDGAKIHESREERFQRLKNKSESERQRKYIEILESQRQANESRQKLQEERRKKIEELKLREEERKKKVEQRRQELNAKEKEKNENLLKRTKEREARAVMIQKQIKSVAPIMQSMTCGTQIRMTSSSHDIGSGSDKCKRVSLRSSSGCDVDRVSSYVLQAAAGSSSATANTDMTSTKRSLLAEGFIEIDGHIIPANTRHVGCFLPYRGSQHRVKGVLAWRLPSDKLVARGSSVAWWAGLADRNGGACMHPRASSAHAALASSSGRYRREVKQSPRVRSSSRHINPVTDSSQGSTPRKSLGEQSLYDRLSRPRGESQPPKTREYETSIESSRRFKNNMSSSCITPSVTSAKRLVSVPVAIIVDKNLSHKRKALPTSAPDSGLTSSPASEMETLQEPRDKDLESSGNVVITKTRTRNNSKNLRTKEQDPVNDSDGLTEVKTVSTTNEEELYRVKLTEQRRLARESKERQQEEQRLLEEKAKEKALVERRRIEEETRLIMEEEIKKLKEEEEKKLAELEKQKNEEDIQRVESEELERALEEKRMEKSRSEDTDRMERKRRLEKIMSRVKRPDESSSQSNEDSVLGVSDLLENSVVEERRSDPLAEDDLRCDVDRNLEEATVMEPMNAWLGEVLEDESKNLVIEQEEAVIIGAHDNVSNTGSPSFISDDVLDLPEPVMVSSTSNVISGDAIASRPQFKSRLLQSIMARGRGVPTDNIAHHQISSSNDEISDVAILSLSQGTDNNNGDPSELVLHSRTYDKDISQISGTTTDYDQSRESHSYESRLAESCVSHSEHHSDTENELTISSLGSGHIGGIDCVPLDTGYLQHQTS